jgi:uncharacterized protein YegP (UPF0339 family)
MLDREEERMMNEDRVIIRPAFRSLSEVFRVEDGSYGIRIWADNGVTLLEQTGFRTSHSAKHRIWALREALRGDCKPGVRYGDKVKR